MTATSPGCSGVTGELDVLVVANVNADFTFSPTAPGTGVTVSFDGSASTGSIASFDWDFDDGTLVSGPDATPSHAFTLPGSYDVTLSVAEAGCAAGDPACSDSELLTVAVGAGELDQTLTGNFQAGGASSLGYRGVTSAPTTFFAVRNTTDVGVSVQ